MSAWTTLNIPRNMAEDFVRTIRARINPPDDPVSRLTDEELDQELNAYAYSGKYEDLLGALYNYNIE